MVGWTPLPAGSTVAVQRAAPMAPPSMRRVTVSNCLFCSIVDGTIPGDIVLETDDVLAFRDIAPQAPTHVLVIPTRHIASLAETTSDDSGLLGALMEAAVEVARQEKLEGGFRTVVNTGDDGGQTVHHIHLHVLGGRRLTWPPG